MTETLKWPVHAGRDESSQLLMVATTEDDGDEVERMVVEIGIRIGRDDVVKSGSESLRSDQSPTMHVVDIVDNDVGAFREFIENIHIVIMNEWRPTSNIRYYIGLVFLESRTAVPTKR